jgi:hypothetical protein
MGWNPAEDASGWQPEGWQPTSDAVPSQPPRRRYYVRAHMARLAAFQVRLVPVIPYADDCYLFEAIAKDPDRELAVELNLYDLCASKWLPNRDYALSEFVLPPIANGFAYEASVAGRSASRPPIFPRTVTGTITDGGITWTARAPGSNAIYAASDPTAESDPTGLTIADVSIIGNFKVLATYSGGTLGQDYDAVFACTIDGKDIVFRQKVRVRKQ